jgi:integrase
MWAKLEAGEGPDGTPRKPMAVGTVRRFHQCLTTLLHAARKDRAVKLSWNPAESTAPRKSRGTVRALDGGDTENTERVRTLSETEARAFVRAAEAMGTEGLLLRVLIATGLRIGEARGLRWEHADLDGGKLRVREAVSWKPGVGDVSGPVKTNKSRRDISLPAPVVAALRPHRQLPSARVFPFTESGSKWIMRTACKLAGIPRHTLHELRHTFATRALAAGAPVKVVSEALGHETVQITMDLYVHVDEQMQRDYLSEVQTALFG